jgi:hypothetical protein
MALSTTFRRARAAAALGHSATLRVNLAPGGDSSISLGSMPGRRYETPPLQEKFPFWTALDCEQWEKIYPQCRDEWRSGTGLPRRTRCNVQASFGRAVERASAKNSSSKKSTGSRRGV